MYDLATIKRLNDAAALKEQYPEHNCAEEVLYNPEYESFGDTYVDRDELTSVQDDNAALAVIARELLDKLYPIITNRATDLFDRREIEARITAHTV